MSATTGAKQRQYEQRSLARQLRRLIAERIAEARERAGAGGLVERAVDELLQRHPEAHQLFTFILGGYAVGGRLTEAFYADPAGIKQAALRQAADQGLLTPAAAASTLPARRDPTAAPTGPATTPAPVATTPSPSPPPTTAGPVETTAAAPGPAGTPSASSSPGPSPTASATGSPAPRSPGG